MLLALDPGSRGCGVALLDLSGRGTLHRAAYVPCPSKKGLDASNAYQMALAVSAWVHQRVGLHRSVTDMAVEVPKVYQASQQKGDQNDLIPLGLVVGCVIGLIRPVKVTQYFPRDWKGTIDADSCTARIIKRLSREELLRCEECPASLAHNLFDAVGIGLKYVGRFEPNKVYDSE